MKVVEKLIRRDVRKMTDRFHKYRNVSIDTIVKSFGFNPTYGCLYKYTKSVWTGLACYKVTLDTFGLIHDMNGSISFTLEEKKF